MRCRLTTYGRCIAAVAAAAILGATAAAQAQTPGAAKFAGPSCFGTVMSGIDEPVARISGSRDPGRGMFSVGDSVYVEGDPTRLSEGQRLVIYRVEGELDHPRTGASLGQVIMIVGEITLLDVDASRAVGRVGSSCGEIEVGDRLLPDIAGEVTQLPAMPEFDADRLISAGDDDATVVYGSSESLYAPRSPTGRRAMALRGSYAAGDVVTIDRGAADGWGPGTVVLFYEEPDTDVRADGQQGDEAVVVAQGYVMWAEPATAAVLITEGDRALDLGARGRRLQ